MSIIIIALLLLLLLLIPGGLYLEAVNAADVYAADAQYNAAAYYADSIAPRVATKTTYEGAFDGILSSGKRL